tara:strand:- start:160 stop:372 length:213 start_codon:yes stop_codon:yes gene_type:complete
MNYQPFFGMNILLSDQLLLELQQQKLAITFLLLATLVCFYFLSITLNDLIRYSVRSPKRNYPAHVNQGSN